MAVTLTANFDIYNEETVRRLQEEDPDILPTYTTDKQKDLAYNKQQVTAAITSAVIQGKSIDKIADDLQTRMTTINRSGAIRTARTAVTSAQNGGTLSSMKELAAMGIEVQKEWVATLDDRTRTSHRALDGQRRDLDKAFSNGLQYPGDSSGNAAEVWNCRCTMVSYIPEYDSNDEPRVTYSEWEKYKQSTGSDSRKITEAEKDGALEKLRERVAAIKSASKGNDSNLAVDSLHPKTLGGAKRTSESMTFEEADTQKVNPYYGYSKGYSKNCQSCVVAFEARQRGYNVRANSYRRGATSQKLAQDTTIAWIDPVTGKHPTLINANVSSVSECLSFLKANVTSGSRYTLEFCWKTGGGHIVNLDLDDSGELRIKDNQRGGYEANNWVGTERVTEYLNDVKVDSVEILRIDNLEFDTKIVDKILEARLID